MRELDKIKRERAEQKAREVCAKATQTTDTNQTLILCIGGRASGKR